MKFPHFVFLLCLSIYQCSSRKDLEEFPKPPGNFPEPNDYVDDVVHHVRELILRRKIDPYTAIDTEFLNVHVNGALYGLGTLTREENAAVIYKPNKIWSIQSKLKSHLLKVQLKWTTSVFGYTISGGATVSIQEILLDVELTMDFSNKKFKLETFDVDQVGHVNVDVNVIPIFDFVVNTVNNVIASLTKNIVFKLIDGPIRLLLQQVIDEHVLEVTKETSS